MKPHKALKLLEFPQKKETIFTNLKTNDCFTMTVKDDSLSGSRIFEGDKLVCIPVNNNLVINNGNIVVVELIAKGLVVKHIFYDKEKIILRSSNAFFGELICSPEQINIKGKVVQLIRDLRLCN